VRAARCALRGLRTMLRERQRRCLACVRAQVFLVRHLERDRLYAMKVYRKKMVVQRNYTRYSLSERRVMPATVRMYLCAAAATSCLFSMAWPSRGSSISFRPPNGPSPKRLLRPLLLIKGERYLETT
jgi:hypothetical protein